MKRIIILSLFVILLQSCTKVNPIPASYYGTWVAETPQFLSTNYRIHTLKIRTDSKGRPYGEYSSTGQYELLDERVDGYVTVIGNLFTIRKKEFQIEQTPTVNEEGKTEMQLGTLLFTKSE